MVQLIGINDIRFYASANTIRGLINSGGITFLFQGNGSYQTTYPCANNSDFSRFLFHIVKIGKEASVENRLPKYKY